MKLLIATTNPGKRAELADLLINPTFEIVTPADLGIQLEVEENGDSYDANARLKAEAFCRASGLITLADDTGLEVDALDGRPGLHSARYMAEPGASDADRRAKLLRELAAKPRPWPAHFHCSVAVAHPSLETRLFEGDAYGQIVPEELGEYGFGYDSLMVLDGAGKTLAEMQMDEKNKYSHRAIAVKKSIPYLLSLK
jgi:non-canonical purine NTP pyrophosphatase (RdgB/HAM1 family)